MLEGGGGGGVGGGGARPAKSVLARMGESVFAGSLRNRNTIK